jgi:CubicO group peptidase (beta-lactamase class C family)
MILVLAAALLVPQDTAAVGRAVRQGIASGVYPGAVVVIGTADTVLLAAGYGHFTWSPRSPVPDPDSSLYDLASVSKVVATTTAAMLLSDRGRLSLSRPVQDYLPQFAGDGKAGVTVRHLLEHRSGMRAWLRLDTLARDSAAARLIVLADSLAWPPGDRVVYSDLNAMLLAWVIEAVTGAPLDVVAHRAVFRPLGMTETHYRPARSLRPRIVPVGLWRGHPIAGELHDQNAARLGGVAGHAGLYSTGRDLARFAQFMLRQGMLRDSTPLARAGAIELFTRRGPGNRALGWEMRDTTERGSAGELLSAAAYGHTGYTGTSIWIDPERDVYVILLTNRVFAPRHRRSISALRAIRADVADAAARLREACRRPGC